MRRRKAREISGDGNIWQEPLPCPVCGSRQYDWLYRHRGEIVGCEDCIEREMRF